ncbi:MFS transporter [Pseudonocardia acaciae]|uniref:MFS transporter n=1 Tax=Pseudonocardia acaciae TaxID=551276 RepID=UPI000687796A|nr:MFS transporter [Pseudonocardia acaciae]
MDDTERGADAPPRAARLSYLGVLMGVFVIVLDTTVVNVAIPGIQRDLGTTVTAMAWVVNGYNLMFAALLLTTGALADRLGGRRVFGIGLVGFAVASLACGLAPSLPVLVAARVAQGVTAALMLPTALSLARHLHAEPTARARALGHWAAVAGAATVLGPLVGGGLVDTLGWRVIFFLNVPVAVLAWALLARAGAETPVRGGRFDVPGQALGIVTLAALAIALTEAGHRGWLAPVVVGTLLAAALAAAAFVRVERRARAPMLPPELLGRGRFAAVSIVGLILSVGVYGQLFVLSLYFQQQRGEGAWQTGMALLPFAAVTVVGPLLAGRLIGRGLTRATLVAGQLAGLAGSAVLAVARPDTPYWALAVGLVLLGLCQSASQPTVAAAALRAAPAAHTGVASGVLTSARQVGSVLGVALLGGLVSAQAEFMPRMHLALLIVAGLFAAGAALAATLPTGR